MTKKTAFGIFMQSKPSCKDMRNQHSHLFKFRLGVWYTNASSTQKKKKNSCSPKHLDVKYISTIKLHILTLMNYKFKNKTLIYPSLMLCC